MLEPCRELSLSLGSIRMCVNSASQTLDLSTRLSAPFCLLFSTSPFVLPDKPWSSQSLPEVLVMRQGQQLPTLILLNGPLTIAIPH